MGGLTPAAADRPLARPAAELIRYTTQLTTKQRQKKMATVVHCQDVGLDCEGIVRAETEEEVLKLAAEHVQSAHGRKEIVQEVRKAIREE